MVFSYFFLKDCLSFSYCVGKRHLSDWSSFCPQFLSRVCVCVWVCVCARGTIHLAAKQGTYFCCCGHSLLWVPNGFRKEKKFINSSNSNGSKIKETPYQLCFDFCWQRWQFRKTRQTASVLLSLLDLNSANKVLYIIGGQCVYQANFKQVNSVSYSSNQNH